MKAATILVMARGIADGGSERIALRLAGAWAAAGRRVIVATAGGPDATDSAAPAGVMLAPAATVDRCDFAGFCRHLVQVIRDTRPDVVLVPGNSYTAVALMVRLGLGGACPPMVWKVSNGLDRGDLPWPARPANRLWLRLHRWLFRHVVVIASSQRDEVDRFVGVDDRRLTLIPNPAVCARLLADQTPPRPLAARAPLILGIGRLEPQKDFAGLIRAFAALASERPERLVILGEGRQRPALEALIARLGLADRVSLPGHVSDVAGWLAAARLLALSSRYEGLPSALLEAMACGTPVVATRCAEAVVQVMDQGALGPLVPCGDVPALAAALRQALRAPVEACRLQARAAAFTLEVAAPLYLAVFDRLLPAAAIGLAQPVAFPAAGG